MEAVAHHPDGFALAYWSDELTKWVEQRMAETFESEYIDRLQSRRTSSSPYGGSVKAQGTGWISFWRQRHHTSAARQ